MQAGTQKKKMPGVGLCEDLIVEILTRLPPKSLLRFRSLSKWWFRCISSPDFIRNHTLSSPQKFLLRHKYLCNAKTLYTIHSEDGLPLTCPWTTTEMSFDFPYTTSAEIIGSCNGILCIIERENATIISLWNPSIRHKLTLPPHRLVFSYSGLGFGFDQKSDDYKIIWINSVDFGKHPKSAFVYAVKTGAWCQIAYPTSRFSSFKSRGCFVNGALHWLVDLHIPGTKVIKRYVMTLDISTYAFGTIALPEPNCAAQQLTTIKGSLAVIFGEPKKRRICWVRGKNHTDTTNASWYVGNKSKTTNPFKDIVEVLEMTTNGKFLLATRDRCHQAYNFVTGVSSRLERSRASCDIVYLVFGDKLRVLSSLSPK